MKLMILSRCFLLSLCFVLPSCSNDRIVQNEKPTITLSQESLSVEVNAEVPIVTVTIADDQTKAENLTVNVSTSNEEIVKANLSGNGNSRNLSISTSVNILISAIITLTVTDEFGQSSSTSLMLEVNPRQVDFSNFVRDVVEKEGDEEAEDIALITIDLEDDSDDFSDLFEN